MTAERTTTDPSAIDRLDARAFCEAHRIPCILEPEDFDRDRRAVAAMERVPTAAGAAHYLAGVRWARVALPGSKPYWEVTGFDRRSRATTPPAFGVWLDGTPSESLRDRPPALLAALRASHPSGGAPLLPNCVAPLPLTRERALAIYERQAAMTRRMSPNVQVQVAVDAIVEGARIAAMPYVHAIEVLWSHLQSLDTDSATPAWLADARDRVQGGQLPAEAIVAALAPRTPTASLVEPSDAASHGSPQQ